MGYEKVKDWLVRGQGGVLIQAIGRVGTRQDQAADAPEGTAEFYRLF